MRAEKTDGRSRRDFGTSFGSRDDGGAVTRSRRRGGKGAGGRSWAPIVIRISRTIFVFFDDIVVVIVFFSRGIFGAVYFNGISSSSSSSSSSLAGTSRKGARRSTSCGVVV